MSAIIEQRNLVISELNTAQDELLAILDKMTLANALDLRFNNPVRGDIDFSVLRDRGFKSIQNVIFEKAGEVTSIRNLPEGVLHLECPNQLLIALDDLPSTIENINCQGNYLSKFDFIDVPKMRELHCAENEITNLDHLPESLEVLECENNQLRRLDLGNAQKLRVLHCSNNPILVIEHQPSSLTDFIMENNPLTEIQRMEEGAAGRLKKQKLLPDDNRLNYLESMYEYFRIKNTYDKKLKQMKHTAFAKGRTKKTGMKLAKSVRPPCINCNRPVGTIFSRNSNNYGAVCGDKSKPCKLHIQLFGGRSFTNEYMRGLYQEEINIAKESIIKQKLKTLFNYISEKDSITLFKKGLNDYTEDSNSYKELLDKYNELHNNEHRLEQIRRKNHDIYGIMEQIRTILAEYQKTDNPETLRSAVEMQVRDLIPEVHNLRLQKYETMRMETNDDGISTLIQDKVAFQKSEFIYGDPARVVHFSMKN